MLLLRGLLGDSCPNRNELTNQPFLFRSVELDDFPAALDPHIATVVHFVDGPALSTTACRSFGNPSNHVLLITASEAITPWFVSIRYFAAS